MFWVIGSVQLIVGAIPSVSSLTDFTWFTVAQKNLWVYGFFALTMFGAMYYLLPRVMSIEWPCPAMIKRAFLAHLRRRAAELYRICWSAASRKVFC